MRERKCARLAMAETAGLCTTGYTRAKVFHSGASGDVEHSKFGEKQSGIAYFRRVLDT